MPAPTTWATTQVRRRTGCTAAGSACCFVPKEPCVGRSWNQRRQALWVASQLLHFVRASELHRAVRCTLQACGRLTARALRRMASPARCTSGGEPAQMPAGCHSTRWEDTGAQVGGCCLVCWHSELAAGGGGVALPILHQAQQWQVACSPHHLLPAQPAQACLPAAVVDACWAADGGCLLTVSTDQTARITTRLHGGHWCEIARPQVRIRWRCWWGRPTGRPSTMRSEQPLWTLLGAHRPDLIVCLHPSPGSETPDCGLALCCPAHHAGAWP